MNSHGFTIGSTTFTLNEDGTLGIAGEPDLQTFQQALAFLDRCKPEWNRVLVIHHIQHKFGDIVARETADRYFGSTTRSANSRNRKFILWVIERGFPASSSFEAVCALKAKIWDSTIEEPRSGKDAQLVVEMLRAGKSSAAIEKELTASD